jgi:hypothetical protein
LRLLNRNDEDLSMFSPEALIFVGDGKRLIFRNVVIQVFSQLCVNLSLNSCSYLTGHIVWVEYYHQVEHS